jgi:hypothetical protein
MSEAVEGQHISLIWALICMAASLAVAILLNETVAEGHGKAIFFGVFVTSFIAKTFQKSLNQKSVIIFLIGVAAVHILLIFILPDDSHYLGGLLFPAGIADIGLFYYLFSITVNR